MSKDEELRTLETDVAFHAYALRDILSDFQERFGRETLLSILNEELFTKNLKVIDNAPSAN